VTWHSGVTSTEYLHLNLNATPDAHATIWKSTVPTATVISIGTSNGINKTGETIEFFAFRAIPGYSSFGVYEGNNVVDGPLILTGFSPALVICKNIDTASGGNWWTVDSARDTYNPADLELLLDSIAQPGEDADMSAPMLDFLSNGFKMRCGGGGSPNSSHTFIYMAWAENPFGGFGGTFGASSGVTPATAR